MNLDDFQKRAEMEDSKRTAELANDFEAILRKYIKEYIETNDFKEILHKYIKEFSSQEKYSLDRVDPLK